MRVPGIGGSGHVDDAVVVAACGGDARAVASIWTALHPVLLRYLRSLGVHDSEDVASSVWIDLSKALPTLDPPDLTALRRLLFTIGRRRMVDELRRRQRRGVATLDADVADPHNWEEASLDTAMRYLQCLPAAQAEVIALRVVVGFSSEEVGRITGQTPGAVRVMAHRGLATLRQLIEAEMGQTDHSEERV